MIVYIVSNLSKNLPINAAFVDTTKVFATAGLARQQFDAWRERAGFGDVFLGTGVSAVGGKLVSQIGENHVELLALEISDAVDTKFAPAHEPQ